MQHHWWAEKLDQLAYYRWTNREPGGLASVGITFDAPFASARATLRHVITPLFDCPDNGDNGYDIASTAHGASPLQSASACSAARPVSSVIKDSLRANPGDSNIAPDFSTGVSSPSTVVSHGDVSTRRLDRGSWYRGYRDGTLRAHDHLRLRYGYRVGYNLRAYCRGPKFIVAVAEVCRQTELDYLFSSGL